MSGQVRLRSHQRCTEKNQMNKRIASPTDQSAEWARLEYLAQRIVAAQKRSDDLLEARAGVRPYQQIRLLRTALGSDRDEHELTIKTDDLLDFIESILDKAALQVDHRLSQDPAAYDAAVEIVRESSAMLTGIAEAEPDREAS